MRRLVIISLENATSKIINSSFFVKLRIYEKVAIVANCPFSAVHHFLPSNQASIQTVASSVVRIRCVDFNYCRQSQDLGMLLNLGV